MVKEFFKQRLYPHIGYFQRHPNLQFLGSLLHEPNLWHLNRRSLAGGMAVGLFTAFLPLPVQMFWAALFAIFFRVNLPLSVSLVWITNPITIPPMFYLAYQIGSLLLQVPTQDVEFSFSLAWMMTTLGHIWKPLLLGCFILGASSALSGYFMVQLLWRLQVQQLWKDRKEKRQARLSNNIP